MSMRAVANDDAGRVPGVLPLRRFAQWAPAVLVIVLALVGGLDTEPRGRACTTDGPQFACWLEGVTPFP